MPDPSASLSGATAAFGRSLWERSGEAAPPPKGRWQELAWGLAQPLLGARTVLSDRKLLLQSVVPVLGLVLLCGLIAWQTGVADEMGGSLTLGENSQLTFDDGLGAPTELDNEDIETALGQTWWGFLLRFWGVLVVLSPLPSFLFVRFYARIAARGHELLGLGPAIPYRKTIGQALGESFRMALAIAFSPLAFVPVVGAVFAAGWTVHWAIAEGLDNARVLPVGGQEPDEVAVAKSWPHLPWYLRLLAWVDHKPESHRVPFFFLRLLGKLARLIARISHFAARPWRPETEVIEARPWASVGFGLGLVVLLAIPGLNLLFRSACAVGGTNFRRQLIGEAFLAGRWPLDQPAASGVASFAPPGEVWPETHLSAPLAGQEDSDKPETGSSPPPSAEETVRALPLAALETTEKDDVHTAAGTASAAELTEA